MEAFFATFNDYVGIPSREYVSFAPSPRAALEILKSYAII